MFSSDFPKGLPEKFRTIRERKGLTPSEFAPLVNAKDGDEILSYENGEGDVPISIFWAYVRMAAVPMDNLWDDTCDLWFGHRVN